MKRGMQGVLFQIRLGPDLISLWFLGVVPLAFVSLRSVEYIQQREMADFWRWGLRRLFIPWRYWFWPSSPGRRSPQRGAFVMKTRRGTYIWMRLRSGLHYQLRHQVHVRQTGLD